MMTRKKNYLGINRIVNLQVIVFFILSVFLGTSYAADLIINNGETVDFTYDQTFDNVTIKAGGTLVFNGPMHFTCSRLSLAGTIIVSGDTVIEVTYGKTNPNSNEWAMLATDDEDYPYYPAYPYPYVKVDYPGSAQDGAPGGPGSPGVSGYDLTLIIYGHLHINNNVLSRTKFVIDIRGQNGGNGGDALVGGEGGDSGSGGSGGHLRVNVHGNIIAQPTGYLEMNVNGGNGGQKGGLDDDTTTGGSGGSLGTGGSGGTIELNVSTIDPDVWSSSFFANGGDSGFQAGGAFHGDPPGITTPGAPGGQITIRTEGNFAPNSRWSLFADGGNGGITGNCRGNQTCYFWNDLCACHQLHNLTGQGGNGGRLTVEAVTLDNVTFYSRGGNGGSGCSGANMLCQADLTTCSWGTTSYGVRIGNGGDGASAGNGGIITVKAKSVGDEVAYVINGGQGGYGGQGGGPFCSGIHSCCTDNICPSGANGANGVNGSSGSFSLKRKAGFLLYLPSIIGNTK
jgi:hypothetical protein